LKKKLIENIDWYIILFYIILIFFGLLNLYSLFPEKVFRQIIWIIISLLFGFLIFFIKPFFYKKFSITIYFLGLFSLFGVLFFGKKINGTRGWYKFGKFNFQPTELSKISTSLLISHIISKSNFTFNKKKIIYYLFLSLIFPITLILLQPDPGSGLVFFSFLLVFLREGMPIKLIFLFIFFIIIFFFSLKKNIFFINIILFFLFFFKKKILYIFLFSFFFSLFSPFFFEKILKTHHKNRIMIIFENEYHRKYKYNIGYNLFFSKTAIGAGKFLGNGYRKGYIKNGEFIPEQHTDYIFCTIGEEWGFLGEIIFIVIYLSLIGRIYLISEKQKDPFGRVFGYTYANILLFHFFINIGMVIGFLPTIGIPLPFISYGGSSLFIFTIFTSIFLKIDFLNKRYLN
jgi:rod shape determining protein RodA